LNSYNFSVKSLDKPSTIDNKNNNNPFTQYHNRSSVEDEEIFGIKNEENAMVGNSGRLSPPALSYSSFSKLDNFNNNNNDNNIFSDENNDDILGFKSANNSNINKHNLSFFSKISPTNTNSISSPNLAKSSFLPFSYPSCSPCNTSSFSKQNNSSIYFEPSKGNKISFSSPSNNYIEKGNRYSSKFKETKGKDGGKDDGYMYFDL
jgi:hypothetical protein